MAPSAVTEPSCPLAFRVSHVRPECGKSPALATVSLASCGKQGMAFALCSKENRPQKGSV